jgi:hypothetical protein
MNLQLTMSTLRSFPAMLIAALSTSTSTGNNTRKPPNAVRAEVAKLNASCVLAVDFFVEGSALGAFHPDFITAVSPWEAALTTRIAATRLSLVDLGPPECSVAVTLRAPFAFELVEVTDVSPLMISPVEMGAIFFPTSACFCDGTTGRLVFALVAMSE